MLAIPDKEILGLPEAEPEVAGSIYAVHYWASSNQLRLVVLKTARRLESRNQGIYGRLCRFGEQALVSQLLLSAASCNPPPTTDATSSSGARVQDNPVSTRGHTVSLSMLTCVTVLDRRLQEFLESTPSIAQHVRKIVLRGTTKCDAMHINANLDVERFLAILAALPNLEEVSLVSLSIDIIKDRLSMIPRSRNLRCLTLEDISVFGLCHFSVILHFLQPFRTIQHLTIGSIRTAYDKGGTNRAVQSLQSLSVPSGLATGTIKINTWNHASLLFLYICRKTCESLHTFHFKSSGFVDEVEFLPAIPRFVFNVGPRLRQLIMNTSEIYYTPFDLSTCSNLQSLLFEIDGPYNSTLNLRCHFHTTLTALRTAPRIPFHLSYEFSPPYDEMLCTTLSSAILWDKLQEFYLGHPCSQHKLSIHFHDSLDPNQAEDLVTHIRGLLPDLASKDLVCFPPHSPIERD
ncbi:hypothetical protein NLI96_g10051 [Meripilus lineatus]|uniref:F-box domain-containing protein n=1 Tax=Meripilus lineatus TaxID=2056292 RepID=A0AAD5UUM2_9APHY|nr:hypothetical protein NLI96_g10051 [Physisporinus lineatus]